MTDPTQPKNGPMPGEPTPGGPTPGGPNPGGPAASIRVLLVDDQQLIRLGMRMVLDAEDGLEVVGEAGDGREALAAVESLSPDVVLMDVRMPGMDGIEATRSIVASFPASRIIILTTFDLDEYAFAGLNAGASGFLLKDARPAELVAAIRAVASGDAAVSPRVTRKLLELFGPQLPSRPAAPEPTSESSLPSPASLGSPATQTSTKPHPSSPAPTPAAALAPAQALLATLTEREREVLVAMAEGLTNSEIAARLYLSESTVKTHLGRVLMKLELRDRVQAVIFAYSVGLAQ